MSTWRRSSRARLEEYDEELLRLYVEEDLTVRETYHRLRDEILDEGEWTTELAVTYRLQELGLKEPRGTFDALEVALQDLDPDAIGTARDGEGSP